MLTPWRKGKSGNLFSGHGVGDEVGHALVQGGGADRAQAGGQDPQRVILWPNVVPPQPAEDHLGARQNLHTPSACGHSPSPAKQFLAQTLPAWTGVSPDAICAPKDCI